MGEVKWTPKAEIDATKLASALTSKISELKAACTQAIFDGFTSTTGHSFGLNELDQTNLTQQMLLIVASGGNYTREIKWKTKSSSVVTLTKEQFFTIVEEAEVHKVKQQEKYWALELQALAAVSPEDIQAVVW